MEILVNIVIEVTFYITNLLSKLYTSYKTIIRWIKKITEESVGIFLCIIVNPKLRKFGMSLWFNK